MTARTAARTDWVARMGALTAAPAGDWAADEVGAAAAVERLVRSARDLLAAAGHGSGAALLDAGVVAAVADAPALVRDLAALPIAGAAEPSVPCDCAERFLAALAAAGPAVYVCRRVRHLGHECLFGDPSGHLCQRVLAAAHRLAR